MKTKQGLRDEIVRLTTCDTYFKEHPLYTGIVLRQKTYVLNLEEADKRLVNNSFIEMMDELYMKFMETSNPNVYKEVAEYATPELVTLLEYVQLPVKQDDQHKGVYACRAHIDDIYDIFYKYSRVGIINQLLDELP